MNFFRLKLTLPLFSLIFSGLVFGVPEGAITTLTVQSNNIEKYVSHMKNNSETFEALGSDVAGVCVTRSGNNYAGEMFVWNAFESVEQAMAATDAYDPMNAPAELAAMREVKYNAIFKPLKPFKLAPGSERLWRLNIAPHNVMPFVGKMTELEAALRAAGEVPGRGTAGQLRRTSSRPNGTGTRWWSRSTSCAAGRRAWGRIRA